MSFPGKATNTHVLAALTDLLTETRLACVPEMRLLLADEVYALWKRTERIGGSEMDLPYWAFAWCGGQALARYVLDHPGTVAGKPVVDMGSGSGIVAIAAALSGAASVTACEPNVFARSAIATNAALNGVAVDIVESSGPLGFVPDVVLAGDVFYERSIAAVMEKALEGFALNGARILVGDPGREFLPRSRFVPVAAYDVAVMRVVEEGDAKHTEILELL